jgi:hypothetical protein
MMTGSRVFYKPHGFDKVVHGWDTAEPTVVEANITGADGYLNDHMREALGALLGTDDVAKVNEVSEWLHGRPARLWRWNRKPNEEVKRALLLGRDDIYGGAVIVAVAYFGVYGGGAARGWVPKISTGNEGS